jgi:hypothetical protein
MRTIIIILEHVPKLYGIGIVVLYSLLLAEFYSTINNLFSTSNLMDKNLFVIFSRINYVTTILSGIIIWLLLTLLFHLTALLFDGHATFKRFLFVSSYLYIIQAIVIPVGIFLLDGIHITDTEDAINLLINNSSFKIAINIVNDSFFPYYLIVAIFIRYIHQIKYIYAVLSVAIPIMSIWLITELFKLL